MYLRRRIRQLHAEHEHPDILKKQIVRILSPLSTDKSGYESIRSVSLSRFYDKTLSDAPTTWHSITEKRFALFSMLNHGHYINEQFKKKSPIRKAIIERMNQLFPDKFKSITEWFRRQTVHLIPFLQDWIRDNKVDADFAALDADIYHLDISLPQLNPQIASFINYLDMLDKPVPLCTFTPNDDHRVTVFGKQFRENVSAADVGMSCSNIHTVCCELRGDYVGGTRTDLYKLIHSPNEAVDGMEITTLSIENVLQKYIEKPCSKKWYLFGYRFDADAATLHSSDRISTSDFYVVLRAKRTTNKGTVLRCKTLVDLDRLSVCCSTQKLRYLAISWSIECLIVRTTSQQLSTNHHLYYYRVYSEEEKIIRDTVWSVWDHQGNQIIDYPCDVQVNKLYIKLHPTQIPNKLIASKRDTYGMREFIETVDRKRITKLPKLPNGFRKYYIATKTYIPMGLSEDETREIIEMQRTGYLSMIKDPSKGITFMTKEPYVAATDVCRHPDFDAHLKATKKAEYVPCPHLDAQVTEDEFANAARFKHMHGGAYCWKCPKLLKCANGIRLFYGFDKLITPGWYLADQENATRFGAVSSKFKFNFNAGNMYNDSNPRTGIKPHQEIFKFNESVVCVNAGQSSSLTIQSTEGRALNNSWMAIDTPNLGMTVYDLKGITMKGGTHQVIGGEHLKFDEYSFRISKLLRMIQPKNIRDAREHQKVCRPHPDNPLVCECVAFHKFWNSSIFND